MGWDGCRALKVGRMSLGLSLQMRPQDWSVTAGQGTLSKRCVSTTCTADATLQLLATLVSSNGGAASNVTTAAGGFILACAGRWFVVREPFAPQLRKCLGCCCVELTPIEARGPTQRGTDNRVRLDVLSMSNRSVAGGMQTNETSCAHSGRASGLVFLPDLE